jgi:hypothetical protein
MVPTSTLKRRDPLVGEATPAAGGMGAATADSSKDGFPATSGFPDEFMFIQLPDDHSNAPAAAKPRADLR